MVLNYASEGEAVRLLFSTYRAPLWSPLTWLRGVTYIFGHADLAHMVGNMSYLLLLGPMLEEKYGSERMALIIAITAIVTSMVNFVFFPSMALCGASGIVFAFILLSSFTSFKAGEIPVSFILVSLFFIGQQIVDGITVQDNISNMAHIVGGIIGGVVGYVLNLNKR
jgi:GlpG protein